MTLGQNIQNARRAQGLSQEALAEKIGVSRQALGKWEKDTALPGLDNLQALAAALGIGVDALLGAENADPAVPAVTLDALRDLLAARDAEEKRRRRLWGCAGGAVFIVLAGLLAGVALQYERQISALNQNYAAIQSSYAAQQAELSAQISELQDAVRMGEATVLDWRWLPVDKLHRDALPRWQRSARANYVFETTQERDKYLKRDYRAPTPAQRCKPYFDAVRGLDEPTAVQWVDWQTWLPRDILRKADRMSMAHSLELRVPFLDRQVLAAAQALPRRYRCTGRRGKIALRAAAARRLPPQLADAPKRGFPVPLADWLRQEKYYALVKAKLTGPVAEHFFDTGALCALLDAHRAEKTNAMTKLWAFYCFIEWYEVYFTGKIPPDL